MSNSTNSTNLCKCIGSPYIVPAIAGIIGFTVPIIATGVALIGSKSLHAPVQLSYKAAVMGTKIGSSLAVVDVVYSSIIGKNFSLQDELLYVVGESVAIGAAYGFMLGLTPSFAIIPYVFPEIIPLCVIGMTAGIILTSDYE